MCKKPDYLWSKAWACMRGDSCCYTFTDLFPTGTVNRHNTYLPIRRRKNIPSSARFSCLLCIVHICFTGNLLFFFLGSIEIPLPGGVRSQDSGQVKSNLRIWGLRMTGMKLLQKFRDQSSNLSGQVHRAEMKFRKRINESMIFTALMTTQLTSNLFPSDHDSWFKRPGFSFYGVYMNGAWA